MTKQAPSQKPTPVESGFDIDWPESTKLPGVTNLTKAKKRKKTDPFHQIFWAGEAITASHLLGHELFRRMMGGSN